MVLLWMIFTLILFIGERLMQNRLRAVDESHPPRIIDCSLFFRRQYLLNTDLINQMLSAQVRQMCSFFVIRQVFANAVDHHHDESAIIHIEPVRAADEFIGAVSYERAFNILA